LASARAAGGVIVDGVPAAPPGDAPVPLMDIVRGYGLDPQEIAQWIEVLAKTFNDLDEDPSWMIVLALATGVEFERERARRAS
jgi:hypothetical protein